MKSIFLFAIFVLSSHLFSQKLNINNPLPNNFDDYSRGDQFLYLISNRSDYDESLLKTTSLYLSRHNDKASFEYNEPIQTDKLKGKQLKKRALNLAQKQLKSLSKKNIHLLEIDSQDYSYEKLEITADKGWVYEQAELKIKYSRLSLLRNNSQITINSDIPIYGMIVKVYAKSDDRHYTKSFALYSDDFKIRLKNSVSDFNSGINLDISNKYKAELLLLKNEIKKAGLKITDIGYQLISKQENGRFYMPRNLYESKPKNLLVHNYCEKIFGSWL